MVFSVINCKKLLYSSLLNLKPKLKTSDSIPNSSSNFFFSSLFVCFPNFSIISCELFKNKVRFSRKF